MTDTVILTMPAAMLARPAPPRAAPHTPGDRSDDVAGWIAVAETRLQTVEEQARAREGAPGPAVAARAHELKAQLGADMSTAICVDLARAEAGLQVPDRQRPELIAARARQLFMESGKRMSTVEAVHQARVEAGLEPPREPTPQDIGARAYELAKQSRGKLSTAAALDQAQAEAAALASRRRSARNQQAWDRRMEQHGRVEEALADTAQALERRLIAHARELIAAARRALADDPLRARELAMRAREAMAAIQPLYAKKPDHGPARRILQGGNGRPA